MRDHRSRNAPSHSNGGAKMNHTPTFETTPSVDNRRKISGPTQSQQPQLEKQVEDEKKDNAGQSRKVSISLSKLQIINL